MLTSLLVLLLATVLEASRHVPGWLQVLEASATTFQGFLTPVLIAIGGLFVWYKFIRQGEHDPRLQPSVTATTAIHEDVIYVFATATVQNNGNVDVVFTDEGSALTIYTTTKEEKDWQPQLPEYVFRGQKRVRPGESLEDQKLIQVRYSDDVALRLDLAVTGQDATGNTVTWDTMTIVSLLAD